MLGAQRHIEARIGQLLGEPKVGRPQKTLVVTRIKLDDPTIQDFRILAHALLGTSYAWGGGYEDAAHGEAKGGRVAGEVTR